METLFNKRMSLDRPTTAPLIAVSFLIDDECRRINDMFMVCKDEIKKGKEDPDGIFIDPSPCLHYGYKVRDCVDRLFAKIADSECQASFRMFWRCLDVNNMNFIYCRKEEKSFHKCISDNLVKV